MSNKKPTARFTEAQGRYDLKRLNKAREELGLKPVRRGERKCLKCDKAFFSMDMLSHRMCDNCRVYTD